MISQIIAVTSVNLRSISQRLGSSAVAIFGIVGVVIVFVGVLSIAEGFRSAMQATGDEDTVMVMRSGADSEMTSGLSGEHVRFVQEKPGIAKDANGPLASPELLVIVNHPLRRSGTDANVPLRGVEPAAFRVHTKVKIVEGRNFEPGRNEIVAGRAATGQFEGLSVGSNVKWGENTWQVVGIFEAGGSAAESELWCDAKVLQPAYRRGNSYQSVIARLASHDSFATLKDALTTDPRLTVMVIREPEYYARQSQTLQTVIRTVGFAIAGLMGIGAIFGAVNTMYNAVASRGREIATLRALGFGSIPVVVSVLAEAVVLSIIGGLIGGLLAYAAFDGFKTSTMNFQSFSQVAFAFRVTPPLLARGLFYAVIMGVLGGLLPAIKAARLPIATALRHL
ncbi:MAG TPA: ABC transporter permease [Vicinamibacterales bacterium]|nr:ABC transporter permease [Vicinamibacterales bacterium]